MQAGLYTGPPGRLAIRKPRKRGRMRACTVFPGLATGRFPTDWDDIPRLFFYDTTNACVLGPDPTYL